jgi:hypothetical protein
MDGAQPGEAPPPSSALERALLRHLLCTTHVLLQAPPETYYLRFHADAWAPHLVEAGGAWMLVPHGLAARWGPDVRALVAALREAVEAPLRQALAARPEALFPGTRFPAREGEVRRITLDELRAAA